jgi:hypothetical protein
MKLSDTKKLTRLTTGFVMMSLFIFIISAAALVKVDTVHDTPTRVMGDQFRRIDIVRNTQDKMNVVVQAVAFVKLNGIKRHVSEAPGYRRAPMGLPQLNDVLA